MQYLFVKWGEKVWLKWFACCPREPKTKRFCLLWFVTWLKWSVFICSTHINYTVLNFVDFQCEWHLVIRKPQLSQTLNPFLCSLLVWYCSPSIRMYVNYSKHFWSLNMIKGKFIVVRVEYLKLMCSWQTYKTK